MRDWPDLIGWEKTLALLDYMQGQDCYFPILHHYLKPVWEQEVRRKWRKHNVKELAREFGCSEREIRNIVQDHEDQMDLFSKPHQ